MTTNDQYTPIRLAQPANGVFRNSGERSAAEHGALPVYGADPQVAHAAHADSGGLGALTALLYGVAEFSKAHLRRIAKAHQVSAVRVTPGLAAASHVLIVTVHNEAHRMAYFLRYYKSLGFEQFIVLDNESTDGLRDLLEQEPGVSIFAARGSYKKSRFGNDWINTVLSRYCSGKWVLYVDADEFFVFPHNDTKSIADLTAHLMRNGQRSVNSLMVDMYSTGKASENTCAPGENPAAVCPLYDAYGYHTRYDPRSRTTWAKGGVRARIFFDDAWDGPALNKTPLVLWKRPYAYLKSSHQLWPARLNQPLSRSGKTMTGALLHFKFLADIGMKLQAEAVRRQHTAEYGAYTDQLHVKRDEPDFVGAPTARYESWRSLQRDRLIGGDDEFA
ncbi:glycosyltransferase family 2 protein [Paraburkholderia jirisanensis]